MWRLCAIALLARIDAVLPGDPLVRMQLNVPLANGRDLAIIHACGRVLSSEVQDGHMQVEADLPESIARQFQEFVADREAVSRAKSPITSTS